MSTQNPATFLAKKQPPYFIASEFPQWLPLPSALFQEGPEFFYQIDLFAKLFIFILKLQNFIVLVDDRLTLSRECVLAVFLVFIRPSSKRVIRYLNPLGNLFYSDFSFKNKPSS